VNPLSQVLCLDEGLMFMCNEKKYCQFTASFVRRQWSRGSLKCLDMRTDVFVIRLETGVQRATEGGCRPAP